MRVSLTADPIEEVPVAWGILSALLVCAAVVPR